jgi:hypothetical protein
MCIEIFRFYYFSLACLLLLLLLVREFMKLTSDIDMIEFGNMSELLL